MLFSLYASKYIIFLLGNRIESTTHNCICIISNDNKYHQELAIKIYLEEQRSTICRLFHKLYIIDDPNVLPVIDGDQDSNNIFN